MKPQLIAHVVVVHMYQHTGAPDDEERMVGDLGNIEADESGAAKVSSAGRQSFRALIRWHTFAARSHFAVASQQHIRLLDVQLNLLLFSSCVSIACRDCRYTLRTAL